MTTIRVIGIDLGKNIFHLIGHDYSGREVFRKKLNRQKLLQLLSVHEPVIVAMEACGGAHWLARRCESYGHQVKLIPAQYVKPYVKTNKNDFIDADAIAEASMRPNMRFVSPKSELAQVCTVVRKIRAGYLKERTACMNRIGSILLEFGISFPRGHHNMKNLFQYLADNKEPVPPMLILELREQLDHYNQLNTWVKEQEKKLENLLKDDELLTLLQSVPGIGPMTASCCLSTVGDPTDFANGRNFAAWIGLTPYQYSTGGKSRMLGISKRGNKELRELFVHAARAVIWRDGTAERYFGSWLIDLKRRKPFNVALVALANKLARIAWSVMVTHKAFEIRV
ncbi:IS110 family transposase [Vibrio sp. SA48]|uniref:IS110 family transposase n=4 Tax=Vibrio TaxID=662 RepID=A0A9X4J0F5_9VIBR|nr:IS110 family transposase [Vibrio aestuarianus]MDE1263447.1 IS110 family transposase [Vibrio aestuarianus]MDE1295553.1 IS110 family transposase [Vibrio aestuarianus]MDE1310296.1 IS110 family transposase [Vibrio aestuarianus]MDE1310375.1 IS110 family transposase [Vibrio aestuarianus]MDE1357347.1 IS110 family transposase [Vibrio aestuarianus]